MKIFERFVPVFCALALISLCLGCLSRSEDERGTKVLVIGDDFTRTSLLHLPALAAEKETDLDLVAVAVDGRTLSGHLDVLSEEFPDRGGYVLLRNRFGKRSSRRIGLYRALELAKWDIVIVQQAGTNAWQEATYEPAGGELISKIRAKLPGVRIFVQEVWSPTPWEPQLKEQGLTPDSFFEKTHAATCAFAKRHGLTVIPVGTAVQNWRRQLPVAYTTHSFGGDVVGGRNQSDEDDFKRRFDGVWEPNGDLNHLNEKGEYLQALIWAARVLELDLEEVKYHPDCVTDDEFALMCEIDRQVES